MNSLKKHLFSFSVLGSPFSVIRVPALSPGVMAVEAAPDFHHEDARAGCPAAVRAPRRPVAPGHRAISLKVILLSAVLAIAGIQDAHSEPEACEKTGGFTPAGNWTLRAAIAGHTVKKDLFTSTATKIQCIYERQVELWYECCERNFYSLLKKQYGMSTIPHTAGDYEADTIGIDLGVPNAPKVAGLGVHLLSAFAQSLKLELKLEVLKNQKAAKAECEHQFKGQDPQEKGKVVPEEPTPYLDCDVSPLNLTEQVENSWSWLPGADEYEYKKLQPKDKTTDDPAERDDYEKLEPEKNTEDDPAKDR